MNLLNTIMDVSKEVDEKYNTDSYKKTILFPVPNFHPRYQVIKHYNLSTLAIENTFDKIQKNSVFLVDRTVSKQKFVIDFLEKYKIKPHIIAAIEDKVKMTSSCD